MKKVLIAFDGSHFSHGAFEFVKRLNGIQKVLATGIFLPAINYNEILYSFGGMTGPLYYEEVNLKDTSILQENIDLFKQLCVQNEIEYKVHPHIEKDVILELKRESRYADVLLISSTLFYENMGKETHDDYIENILHKSECPVVLLPENDNAPENIILAYDGSESSVYAIKQFAYLFSEFAHIKTTLVYAGPNNIPNLAYINELVCSHFTDLEILELKTTPRKYFDTWLQNVKRPMLITGSHARTAMSEMLKESFVTKTIQNLNIPIFIAHK